MPVKYVCKECLKENKKTTICEFCFGLVESKYTKPFKRENTMTKHKALGFLKSQKYIATKFARDKKIAQNFDDLIDFINKAIPSEDQNSLF